MRLKNYDIHCYRGESFTLDFEIVNDDGSPYIIPDTGHKWYLLLTLSSIAYPVEEKDIVEKYWLDLSNDEFIPKFNTTVPQPIDDFSKIPDDLSVVYYDHNKTYKYYVKEGDEVGEWKDYSFRVILRFSSDRTKHWIEQRYLYSLKLVNDEDYDDCTILLEPHNVFVHSDRTEV